MELIALLQMKKKSLIIIIIVAITLIFIFSVYAQDESKTEKTSLFEKIKDFFRNLFKRPMTSPSENNLGNLCSGEENCKEFCLNNKGQCEDYCKGKENELCKIIFPPERDRDDSDETSESDLLTDQLHDCKPIGNHQYYRTDHTFVIDPTDSNIMYVNVEHKGFFKSIDGGRTWELKTKGIKTYAKKDDPTKPCHGEYPVALIDPKNSQHIILALSGTPTTFDFGYTKVGGLVESWDGAENWKQMLEGWMNIYITDVAIDPTDSNIIYYTSVAQPSSYWEADPNRIFVTKGLVYKTIDGGKNWEELPTGFLMNTGATEIYLNSENPKEILVPTFTDSRQSPNQPHTTENVRQMGFLKSSDGGSTWTTILSLPKGYDGIRRSSGSKKNFMHMFVEPYSSSDQPPKSFYSTDGGMTFKQSNIFIDIAMYNPYDETGNRLLGYQRTTIGSDLPAIYESNDAGATWRKLSNAPKEILDNINLLQEVSNIVWDPNNKDVIYLTGAGGYIWKSIDGGKNWQVILSLEKLPN